MNKTTLFIIIGIIAAIGLVYYFSQSANANAKSNMAPKCCIEKDSLGNCTKWVWCSDANATAVVSNPNGTIFTNITQIPVPINNVPAGAK